MSRSLLFLGDAIITPVISVLSAVEGSRWSRWPVGMDQSPITVTIIAALLRSTFWEVVSRQYSDPSCVKSGFWFLE